MKKAISIILSLALIFTAFPLSVFAATDTATDFYDAANWIEKNSSDNQISWGHTTVTTATKDGVSTDVIKLTANAAFSHGIKMAVEKNSEYVLSFDYQASAIGTFSSTPAAISSVGVAPLKDGEVIYRAYTLTDPAAIYTITPLYAWEGSYEGKVTDSSVTTAITDYSAENWYSVEFDFNSGDNDALQFFLNPIGSGLSNYLYLANFTLTKKTADMIESDKLNDAANWATYNSKNTKNDWWGAPEATEYNGKAAIKIKSYNALVTATKLSVEKNTDYRLTFAYTGGVLNSTVLKTVGIATITDSTIGYMTSGDIYNSGAIGTTITDWNTVSIEFSSGENTEFELFVHPSANNSQYSASPLYLADFNLKNLGETSPDYTCEELNNVDNWTVLRSAGTVIDWMVPSATTATKNGDTIDAIQITGNSAGSYVSSFGVSENHTYRLSFDYYAETLGTLADYTAVITSCGVAPLKDGAVVYRTHQTTDPAGIFTVHAAYSWEGSYAAEDRVTDNSLRLHISEASADNWYSISFEFNSGDNEKLEFYINPVSLTGNATFKIANFELEDKGAFYSAEMLSADETLYNTYGTAAYDTDAKGFKLSYIGSGIEFVTNGSEDVSVNIKLPTIATYKEYSADSAAVTRYHTIRLKLWIDGTAQDDIIINQKYAISENIVIATDLSEGDHTIKLVRATEPGVGKELTFMGVLLKGTLSAISKADKPYIEVYGDSISSGYGNIASGEYTNFNKDLSNYVYVKDGYAVDSSTEGATKTLNTSEYNFEDGTKTYAYLAAQNIGADIGVFSKSGLGITVYGGKAEETTETMAKWYPNLPVNKNADYVIINHITNDSKYYNSAAGLTKEGLADAYAQFIETVRADHEGAKIIVVYGMMPLSSADEDYYATGEEVVLNAVAKAKATDDNVYALMLPAGNSGGASHPSEAQHATAAELLTQFINGLDTVATENYAGIRAETDSLRQGIRVRNTISLSAIEDKNIVTYGAVAIRKARLSRGATLTLNAPNVSVGIAYNSDETNGYKVQTTPILREQTDTENIFSGVLVGIAQRFYDDTYAVRSFAIDDKGNVYYGEVLNVSVYDVVYSILESGSAEDIKTANGIVDEIIAADATDTEDIIMTYAEWCEANGCTDKSTAANG